jgi:hypothetical protein
MGDERISYLLGHVVPMLSRVNASLERCSPRRGVYRRASVLGAAQRLPVHKKRDSVFGLRDTIVRLAGSNTGGRAGNDARRHSAVLHDPAVDVDMVRREVVATKRVQAASLLALCVAKLYLISESLPAHARKVSSWLLG